MPDKLAELWRRIAIATTEELRLLVANTPAQPFLESENARMFGSIRSVATSALAGLEHAATQRGPRFSIRDFVRGTRHPCGGGRSRPPLHRLFECAERSPLYAVCGGADCDPAGTDCDVAETRDL